MFDWFEEELAKIKTPRFHVVEGGADPELREAIAKSTLPVDHSYKDFVLKFGNAKLYRTSLSGYRLGVFRAPHEEMQADGSYIYQIGFREGARIYFAQESVGCEFSIFEFALKKKRKVGETFYEWFKASCSKAKKVYGDKKWTDILRGPEPFSVEEERILQARHKIKWAILGIDADGNHIFQITNLSDLLLPGFTVGVHSRDRRLNGSVRLDIGGTHPGQTSVVHVNCYKEQVSPEQIEVFSLPDPRPEEREMFWEFGRSRV